MKIVFAPESVDDLEATVEYIRDRSPNAAARLAERVLAVVDELADRSYEGPQSRLKSGELVRSWPVPPLRVYYQRREGALVILRIYHQAQRPIAE